MQKSLRWSILLRSIDVQRFYVNLDLQGIGVVITVYFDKCVRKLLGYMFIKLSVVVLFFGVDFVLWLFL